MSVLIRVRNQLEARGVCVLGFTYGDVMQRFDETVEVMSLASKSAGRDRLTDAKSAEGLEILDVDETGGTVTARVDPDSCLQSEQSRERSLRAANRLRAEGWRLRRRT